MSVRAVTPRVPAVHGLQFYRDADHHDLANDEHLTATFDDVLGLPEPPPRRRVRGLRTFSRASDARSQRITAPDQHPASKESHA